MVQRERRVSLTFRKVNREGVCRCSYHSQCDSQGAVIPDPHQAHLREDGERPSGAPRKGEVLHMPAEELCQQGVPEIERVYVHDFYDSIASHFDK